MRALTVRQPWAWAIIHGGKDVENRSRNIAGSYRGPVAIHAGLTSAILTPEQVNLLWGHAIGWPGLQPGGVVIGVADLVDVHDYSDERCHRGDGIEIVSCSPWAQAGHRHLMLANPRPLIHPISWRGALGLWSLPDGVLAGRECWDAAIPGGYVCVVCGMPTESEPCPTHGGAA